MARSCLARPWECWAADNLAACSPLRPAAWAIAFTSSRPTRTHLTGQVADLEIHAAYDDMDAVAAFVRNVDAVTFEFENVPAATAELADAFRSCSTGRKRAAHDSTSCSRKDLSAPGRLPHCSVYRCRLIAQTAEALVTIGCPAVVKTAGFGYDGKGQVLIQELHAAEAAWQSLGTDDVVLEGFVDFDRELSVIVARSVDSEMVTYGPFENSHQNHILDVSSTPAQMPQPLCDEALDMARSGRGIEFGRSLVCRAVSHARRPTAGQ